MFGRKTKKNSETFTNTYFVLLILAHLYSMFVYCIVGDIDYRLLKIFSNVTAVLKQQTISGLTHSAISQVKCAQEAPFSYTRRVACIV